MGYEYSPKISQNLFIYSDFYLFGQSTRTLEKNISCLYHYKNSKSCESEE